MPTDKAGPLDNQRPDWDRVAAGKHFTHLLGDQRFPALFHVYGYCGKPTRRGDFFTDTDANGMMDLTDNRSTPKRNR